MAKIIPKPPLQKRPASRNSVESDSFSSFFFTWQPKHRPPPPHAIQTGRIVSASEFYLFYTAVMLLVLAAGLIALSLWSIFFKLPFAVLINTSTELAYFTLPGAVLCLPAFWLLLSIHNDEKSRKYLSLVFFLLAFSALLTAIGIYVGFTHRTRDPKLEEFELRPGLLQALKMSARNGKIRNAWDRIQSVWSCCGVDGFSDWFLVRSTVPESCCGKVVCRNNATSSDGCLKIIIAALALQTRVFNGINCVALFIMSCTLITVASVYLCGRKNQRG